MKTTTVFNGIFNTVLFISFLVSYKCNAQYTIQRDFSFNAADTVAENPIDLVSVQPDGKVLLFNNGFTQYIYRLNENGTRDTSFFNNPTTYPYKIIAAASGNIYLISSIGQNASLSKLHADGTQDSSFYYHDSTISYIEKVLVQSDEKLILLCYNANNRPFVKRLNSDGSIDNSFTVGSPTSGDILDIALQPDGKCIVAGSFLNYAAQNVFKKIIRLNVDGTIDQTFSVGNANVYNGKMVVEVQSDGKIIIGGNFTFYNPYTTLKGLIRLNSNGTRDTSFTTVPMHIDYELKIKSLSNGKIITMGDYGQLGDINSPNYLSVNRLLNNGTIDNSFPGQFNGGINSYQYDIASTGKVYLGTYYNHGSTYNDTVFTFLLGIDENGYVNTYFRKGINALDKEVRVCKQFQDGGVWVGGGFTNMGNHMSSGLIKLTNSGDVDSSFISGYGFPATKYGVMDLLEINNDRILVAGQFTNFNENPSQNLIQLYQDGSIDNSFNFDNAVGSYAIQRILLQSDSKIVAVAYMYLPGGLQDYKLIRLNTDGTVDPTFNTGNGFVYNCNYCSALSKNSIQLDNNGKLVVAGAITEYNGQAVKKILRLNTDGSRDTTFAYNFGFNNTVVALAIQPDNKIIVSGLFTEFNSTPVSSVVRLNENGTLDTTFHFPYASFISNYYTIPKIVVLPDAKILVSHGENPGVFGFNGLFRLNADGTIDSTFTMQSGFEGGINDYSIMQDNGMLVGGYLRGFDQTEFNHLAKLKEIQPMVVSNQHTAVSSANCIVFPNPCNDYLTLSKGKNVQYVIYDTQGRIVKSGQTNQIIDVKEIQSGIYVLELTSGTEKMNTKFIRN